MRATVPSPIRLPFGLRPPVPFQSQSTFANNSNSHQHSLSHRAAFGGEERMGWELRTVHNALCVTNESLLPTGSDAKNLPQAHHVRHLVVPKLRTILAPGRRKPEPRQYAHLTHQR